MDLFASSSFSDSSSAGTHLQYEVFISFRGEDTRYTFTSHLYEALCQRKIVTFMDKELERGDEISQALLNAIKKSKVAVVIFSEDYASSKWCLNELVEILECKKRHGQIVIPVFYHVDPSDVRKQTKSYGKSFAEYEKKGIPTLQKWRIALTEASNLSGWHAAVFRDEAVLTKGIVDDIWNKLSVTYKIDDKNLVGIEPKVEKIESLLNMGSGNVCVVGLWGFGGIGKTTLAYTVFNKIRTQFEGSCFLSNIREESEKDVERLRQRLYSEISGEENGKIVDDVRLNFHLSRKKVLIVFDDVTNLKQIRKIVGNVNRFQGESRFIITSRDKQVLQNCICNEEKIYKVNELCAQEAHQLFSRFAFKQEHPEEDYTELSRKMVDYAKGSPLALEVLGSSLLRKSKREWESAIEKLKRAPDQEIQSVLKVSFDGLDYEQKNVFLDVACFLKGQFREDIVNFYDYNIEITLSTLIDRCLLSVDSYDMITMHDLLQEMGRHIDREQSTENPGKRSRLWHPDDAYQVLTRNEGIRAIKGISLDMSKTRGIHLNKDPFIKMSELCFLEIYNSSKKRLSCSEDFQFDYTKLRFLHWEYYPMKSLRSSFSLTNLVILDMENSEVEQLWNGVQPFPNLKEIHLGWSRNLTALPDLSLAPKLSGLTLSFCRSLTSLPSSIGNLSQLRSLFLGGCNGALYLPKEFNFKSIEVLWALGLPLVADTICSHLLYLSNIRHLILSSCRIEEIPDTICQLSSLIELSLAGNHFDKLPENIMRLSKLQELGLSDCRKLQFLPELPRSLKYLHAERCSSLKAVHYSLSILLATTEKVSFSECYMLDEDKFATIIQEALLEIQRRFRECPAQAIEEDDEDGHAFLKLSSIAYPGWEIPEIVEFQHLGSIISTELSHDMIGGKIVGFAFFAVYRPQPYVENSVAGLLNINFHYKATLENGEVVNQHFMDSILEETSEEDSPIVVVGYTRTSNHRIFPSQYQSIFLEMKLSFDWSCIEVEECGLYLFSCPVSEEELKGASSNCSEEKQLERSPKRLKIS